TELREIEPPDGNALARERLGGAPRERRLAAARKARDPDRPAGRRLSRASDGLGAELLRDLDDALDGGRLILDSGVDRQFREAGGLIGDIDAGHRGAWPAGPRVDPARRVAPGPCALAGPADGEGTDELNLGEAWDGVTREVAPDAAVPRRVDDRRHARVHECPG